MKKTLILGTLTLLVTNILNAQNNERLEYGSIKKGNYTEYFSKNKDLIKIGDSLQIGEASNFDKFVFITQGQSPMHADHQNKKVKINSIEVFGRKNSGYAVYFSFKGFGLLPVYVNYESAIESGEIKLLGAKMTQSEAIEKLKKQKELLDLEIITQEEYNKIKENLIPIINQ